jgi:hypothetical protein
MASGQFRRSRGNTRRRGRSVEDAVGSDAGHTLVGKIAGTFANDPVYEETMRLRREYREAQRPAGGLDSDDSA